VHEQAALRRDAVTRAKIPRVLEHERRRNDSLAEHTLRAVEIRGQRVQQSRALPKAALE
jgi:DUF1009 family protein